MAAAHDAQVAIIFISDAFVVHRVVFNAFAIVGMNMVVASVISVFIVTNVPPAHVAPVISIVIKAFMRDCHTTINHATPTPVAPVISIVIEAFVRDIHTAINADAFMIASIVNHTTRSPDAVFIIADPVRIKVNTNVLAAVFSVTFVIAVVIPAYMLTAFITPEIAVIIVANLAVRMHMAGKDSGQQAQHHENGQQFFTFFHSFVTLCSIVKKEFRTSAAPGAFTEGNAVAISNYNTVALCLSIIFLIE